MTPLEAAVVALARSFVGHRETARNSSRWIDEWLAFVGQPPGKAYCAAFVSWVISRAAGGLEGPPPAFKRSAGALRLLEVNAGLALTREQARARLAAGRPVVWAFPVGDKGLGHAGFGVGLETPTTMQTVEANTGPGMAAPEQDRDGQGVFARGDRLLATAGIRWAAIG